MVIAVEEGHSAPPEKTKVAYCNYFSRWIGCFDVVTNTDAKPNLREGVLRSRVCTDIPWLLACFGFTAFCVVYLWLPVASNGQASRFLGASDYLRNTCGQGDFKDKPWGAWPDPMEYAVQICVESCADTQYETFRGVNEYVTEGGYESEGKGFWCIPTDANDLYEMWLSEFQNQGFLRYVQDLYNNYMVPVWSLPITVVLLFGFFIFVWCCLKVVIRCLFFGLFAGTGFTAYEFMKAGKEADETGYYTGVGILCVGIIFFYVMMCCWNSLMTVVTVLQDASAALIKMPQLLLVPIITLPVVFGILVAWYCISLLMFALPSDTQIEFSNEYATASIEHFYGADYETNFYYEESYSTDVKNEFWIHLFWMLWGVMFIEYFNFMIIASCVSDWYLDKKLVDNPVEGVEYKNSGCCAGNCCRIFWSILRTIRYHLGTIAFASALIALIQTIEAILLYSKKQLGESNNPFAKTVLNMILAVVKCLECIISRCSKTTLVVTAVLGSPFCAGCGKTMALLWNDMAIMTMGNGMIVLMVYISNFVIAILATGLSVLLACDINIQEVSSENVPDMNSLAFPAGAAFIISWFFTKVMLGVWDASATTILTCHALINYYYKDEIDDIENAHYEKKPKVPLEENACDRL